MIEIRKYFERIVPMSDNDWAFFSSKLTRRTFPKKSIILPQGKKENFLSFIEKGMTRMCIPKEIGDLTFSFEFEGNFTSAYSSFLTQQPSEYQIEAITETVLWSISHADLQEIYAHTATGNTLGRYASEGLYIKKIKRELSLLNQSAEDRYLNLFTEEPRLLQQIPLKYIASYIGITPQALSRIRARIS
jgi:CRP-like cAMP-binding protein